MSKNPLARFIKEGWEVVKVTKIPFLKGTVSYELKRFRKKEYGWICPYSLPGWLWEERIIWVNRSHQVIREMQTFRSDRGPYCDYPRNDSLADEPDQLPKQWSQSIQLELLLL